MTSVGLVVENPVLDKIQSFLNDSVYQELTQNTARYNVRIRKDRVYRQPYIDGQTGVAQRHCNLFVSDKQRMPGILQGQVYTYPARRWKTKHRSYLASFMQATKADPEEHTITTVENPAAIVASAPVIPEEVAIAIEKPLKVSYPNIPALQKEPWTYYEENVFEEDIEEDFESEEDFEDETYTRKGNKKRKTPGRKPKTSKPKKKVLKAPARLLRSIKKDENDTENKPYVCELCGMRYKTRPGLTYHCAHSHRDEDDNNDPSAKANSTPTKPDLIPSTEPLPFPNPPLQQTPPPNTWTESNGIGRTSRRTTPGPTVREAGPPLMTTAPTVPLSVPKDLTPIVADRADAIAGKKRVPPSPYCDFCLGDSTQNKKTGQSEQLVSCADCGRSGHPSCLQFTENMMKSVLRYRWQCIECKTCTLCGTSENDDQLLFCDDCDRGYHLYCLTPPLSEPPEGEWSCYLCIKEFHNK